MNIKVNKKLFFWFKSKPIIRNPTEIIVEGIEKYLKSLNIATTNIATTNMTPETARYFNGYLIIILLKRYASTSLVWDTGFFMDVL